jgi:hypothetical protein
MTSLLKIYTVLWVILCLIALATFIKDRRTFPLFYGTYWRFIFTPWKIVTFLLAVAGLIIVASSVSAPDLDRFDAVSMAVLTFLTAPWAVGVIYRTFKVQWSLGQFFGAVCIWLFCGSWAFDTYILFKDGQYPLMWPTYMLGTLGLYVLGGLFWNLEWKPGRGTIFAFMEGDWPTPSATSAFHRMFGVALLFMVAVSALFILFFWSELIAVLR